MKIYDDKNKLLAIIIQNKDIEKEKNFVTDNEQEMQLASFNLKEGTKILNHYHPKQERNVEQKSKI